MIYAESRPSTDSFHAVTVFLREMSRHQDPQALLEAYASRARLIIPIDRTLSLSRQGLEFPFYRITRSDLRTTSFDPWAQVEKLPLLSGGLLAALIYAGVPRVIAVLEPASSDPAGEQLASMGSLVAIPHFDDGVPINMVVHMCRETRAFDHADTPQLVLVSGLFDRAMKALITARELRKKEAILESQYKVVTELSDTVIAQALALKTYAATLMDRVRQRTAQLEEAHLDAITMLAVATEQKDKDTGDHIGRIQRLSEATALAMGMGRVESEDLGRSAILHDVGKLHVPDAILMKPGLLTPVERSVMQQHSVAGEMILPPRPSFATARRIARSHHENYDGTGYPDAVKAGRIPPEARIVHVVDVYDALRNHRPYKSAWPRQQVLDFMRGGNGHQFDPLAVEAFLDVEARRFAAN